MKRFTSICVAAAAALLSGAAPAADYGNAKEARAMLEKAVAEMKKDKAAAIAKFNKGEGGFKDRDLYVFCATPDGATTAHANPKMIGNNLKTTKDKKGKAFGEEMFKVAEVGKYKQVSYMWPKPGSEEPVQKSSYVTKVADQVCGVGYYKR
jgi:signal transduction histidine kinase